MDFDALLQELECGYDVMDAAADAPVPAPAPPNPLGMVGADGGDRAENNSDDDAITVKYEGDADAVCAEEEAEGDDEDFRCMVCFELMSIRAYSNVQVKSAAAVQEINGAVRLPCGHAYHSICVVRGTLMKLAGCPVCKPAHPPPQLAAAQQVGEEEDDDDDDDVDVMVQIVEAERRLCMQQIQQVMQSDMPEVAALATEAKKLDELRQELLDEWEYQHEKHRQEADIRFTLDHEGLYDRLNNTYQQLRGVIGEMTAAASDAAAVLGEDHVDALDRHIMFNGRGVWSAFDVAVSSVNMPFNIREHRTRALDWVRDRQIAAAARARRRVAARRRAVAQKLASPRRLRSADAVPPRQPRAAAAVARDRIRVK